MNNEQIRKLEKLTDRIFKDVGKEGLDVPIRDLCMTITSLLTDTRVAYYGNYNCVHQGQPGGGCEIKAIFLDNKGKCRFYRKGKKIPNLVI